MYINTTMLSAKLSQLTLRHIRNLKSSTSLANNTFGLISTYISVQKGDSCRPCDTGKKTQTEKVVAMLLNIDSTSISPSLT